MITGQIKDQVFKVGEQLPDWPHIQPLDGMEHRELDIGDWPRISVVTPSFNQGDFLESAIQSVLHQNYPNLEYIVIDGGSTDNSVQVLNDYSDDITYWHSKEDGGQADAIATGFEMSSGEILCWLNSDDLLLPNTLYAVAQIFSTNKKVDLLYGNRIVISRDAKVIGRHVWLRYFSRSHWYDCQPMAQECSFWRRKAYFDVGGIDRSLFFIMDWDLFYKIWCNGKFKKNPRYFGCLRIHEESKNSRHQLIRQKEITMLLAKYGLRNPGKLSRALMVRFDRMQIWVEKFVCKNTFIE